MQKLDLYIHALQQAGHRITAQRRTICDYLATTDKHPTPYEIYGDISQAHPEISRATVYNTLKVLQSLGVIVEIAFGADHTHYDTDPTPHINLICLRCHSITDFHADVSTPDQQAEIAHATGFQPVTARMDILGFCADCRARRRAEIIAQWNAEKPDGQHGSSTPVPPHNTEKRST
jgi:Fur family peroxide stress response transcriptional regulator